MLFFDLVHCYCILYELVECSYLFGDDLVGYDIFFAQDGVEVFDVLHSDDLMRELVIIFVEEGCEFEVEDQRVAIFGLDEETTFEVDID